jgi:hypothetical protein
LKIECYLLKVLGSRFLRQALCSDQPERVKQGAQEFQASIDSTTEEINTLDDEMQRMENRITELRGR